jgi:hypothetical protein
MKKKINLTRLFILTCILIIAGLTLIGFGVGKLTGKKCEVVGIAIGLGLVVVATFIVKQFFNEDTNISGSTFWVKQQDNER